MKTDFDLYREIAALVPRDMQIELRLCFEISNRVYELMQSRGIETKQLAADLHKRPADVRRWISGQHNFDMRTLAMLSDYFGEPLITVPQTQTQA